MDANTLPKGHIIGWAPPPKATPETAKPLSKSAKKNAKRREKKAEKKEVPEDWEEEGDSDEGASSTAKDVQANGDASSTGKIVGADHTQVTLNSAAAPNLQRDSTAATSSEDVLASAVKKMTL